MPKAKRPSDQQAFLAEPAPVLRQALTNGRRLERRLAQLGETLLEAYRKNRSRKEA